MKTTSTRLLLRRQLLKINSLPSYLFRKKNENDNHTFSSSSCHLPLLLMLQSLLSSWTHARRLRTSTVLLLRLRITHATYLDSSWPEHKFLIWFFRTEMKIKFQFDTIECLTWVVCAFRVYRRKNCNSRFDYSMRSACGRGWPVRRQVFFCVDRTVGRFFRTGVRFFNWCSRSIWTCVIYFSIFPPPRQPRKKVELMEQTLALFVHDQQYLMGSRSLTSSLSTMLVVTPFFVERECYGKSFSFPTKFLAKKRNTD